MAYFQVRIIGNHVKIMDSPAAVMTEQIPINVTGKPGRRGRAMMSKSEDLPLLCADTPQGLGERVFERGHFIVLV